MNQFSTLKEQELTMEMQVCARNLKTLIKVMNASTTDSSSLIDSKTNAFLTESESSLLEVSNEIVLLQRYIRCNFGILVDIGLVYDEVICLLTKKKVIILHLVVSEIFVCVANGPTRQGTFRMYGRR